MQIFEIDKLIWNHHILKKKQKKLNTNYKKQHNEELCRRKDYSWQNSSLMFFFCHVLDEVALKHADSAMYQ